MKKYKQIVFDVDGTLVNTQYADIHSLRDTLKTLKGEDIEVDKLAFAFGMTGEDTLKRLGVAWADIPKYLSVWTETQHRYRDTIAVFDGIPELLADLTEQGYGLGIVTSRTKKEFAYDFDAYGITSYFKTIVCADDTGNHKPDPEPLLKYMELTGCDRREALYIGDSAYDMACASNAGVDFGLAAWGNENIQKAALVFAEPAAVAQSLACRQEHLRLDFYRQKYDNK